MNSKNALGQFYTTNSDYILEGFDIQTYNEIIEPFVGQGDILNWIKKNNEKYVETYDIDPKIKCDEVRDSLLKPPIYKDKFVITNPPYLSKNKNKNKTIYEKYKTDDLYKSAIISFIEGHVSGGILIIPVNFLCGEDSKIRNTFFEKYRIIKCRIFEEQVFDDTSYSVMVLQFVKDILENEKKFEIEIYPSKKTISVKVEKKYDWRVGQKFLVSDDKKYNIGRLTVGQKPSTNLKLFAIDSGGMDGRIRIEITEDHFYGKESDRTLATLTTNFPIENEYELAKKFNEKLEELREKYNSLFLSTYRESTKNYMRKRISFKQAYSLIENILNEKF